MLPQILSLLHNQFVGGGFMLMAAGSVIALLRHLPSDIWAKIKSQCMVSVTVVQGDPLFDWITIWLSDHPYSKKTRRILATTKESSVKEATVGLPEVIYSPAKGQHFFFYQGRFIWLSREKEGKDDDTPMAALPEGDRNMRDFLREKEQYKFRTIGRAQEAVRCLIHDVLVHTEKERREKTAVFTSVGSWWEKLFSYTPRSLDSVFLDGGKKEELLEDMQEFISQREWYVKRGVPYSRKYLFYGPPGNGKTSIIAALAGFLNLNLYVLNLSDQNLNDTGLASLFRQVRAGSLLLLEDVDAAVPSRTNIERETPIEQPKPSQSGVPMDTVAGGKKEEKGITLSGLLNVLDGVLTPDGSMVVMTTNRYGVLDAALVRPGRVDKPMEFGFATEPQIIQSFLWFYPDRMDEMESFVSQFVGNVSMATVQQKLMEIRKPQPILLDIAQEKCVAVVPSDERERCASAD